jgi:hypothetical protein
MESACGRSEWLETQLATGIIYLNENNKPRLSHQRSLFFVFSLFFFLFFSGELASKVSCCCGSL